MIRLATVMLAAGAGVLGLAAAAEPLNIELPFGEVPTELAGADAQVVVNHCSSCHSLDYITTQPRGKGEQFWRDSIAKMINVYKAPLSQEQADAVATTLARKFG